MTCRSAAFFAFCAVASAIPSSAQSSLAGTVESKARRLPRDVVEMLPEDGRAFTPPDLEVHWGLGTVVRLEPGRRAGAFDLVIGDKRRSFRAPGTFDVDFTNARKKEREHRFEVVEKDGTWRVRSLSGIDLDVAKHDVWILDLDHDGAFDGALDGWVARPPGVRKWSDVDPPPKIHVISEHLVVDGQKYWFRPDRDGFWVEIVDNDPRPTVDLEDRIIEWGDDLALFKKMNTFRLAVGLPPLKLDDELSAACTAHAKYCDVHGKSDSEQEGAEGYNEAGARIASDARITEGSAFPGIALDMVGGVYSREVLLDPAAFKVGIGTSKKYTVFTIVPHAEPPTLPPFVWPPDRAANVTPQSPRGDDPSPLGDKSFSGTASQRYGYPITVHVGDRPVADVQFSLRIEDQEAEVPIHLSWPGNPGNPARPDNAHAIVAIPQAKLQAGTTYVAKVSCKLGDEPFEQEWVFTTYAEEDDDK